MSRICFVDPVGGAAGDMLLAALLDAGASGDAVRLAVESVLPGRVTLSTEEVRRAGVRARRLMLAWSGDEKGDRRSAGDLAASVEGAALPPGVRDRALAVLGRLGTAEARVHGEHGALHELGDDDTLVDVVGVAAALDALDVKRIEVSSIPLPSGGRLAGSHSGLPLPAPVTLELLRGFPVRGEGAGETVTPTAAAILAALGSPAERFPSMTVESLGYGAGTRDAAGRPNIVRVILGTPTVLGGGPRERDLLVLEANLDDLSPQLVADAAEALLQAGALDAWIVPAQVKKGRPGVVLSALCPPELEDVMRLVFFRSTSTLGVRSIPVRRAELERMVERVVLADGDVRVKLGLLDGRVVTATPEHDDVAALARRTGRTVREIHEEASVAANTLRLHRTEGSVQ